MRTIIFLMVMLAGNSFLCRAQEEPDHIPTKKERNFRYSILGGPSYTPDYGLLLGGSALLTFRMNPSDTTQLRSVVPLAFAVMFKGGFNLVVRPQLFFKEDKFRIFGQFKYKNTLDNYYGVGYRTNRDYERGEETSQFRYNQVQVNPWFMFRLKDTDFFCRPSGRSQL